MTENNFYGYRRNEASSIILIILSAIKYLQKFHTKKIPQNHHFPNLKKSTLSLFAPEDPPTKYFCTLVEIAMIMDDP